MNNSRAEIMAALQKASSLSEQIALVAELEALDAREASNIADSRSLDFTSSIVDQTLSPVLVHEFHTASTDWLSMDDDNNDAGYHQAVMAKAAVWYGKVSNEVKSDGAEFAEQARGIARRTASAYGVFADDAEATFLSYVAFLNREAASGLDQIDQLIDPNNMPKQTEYPADVFPTFEDPVHPINEQAVGMEGQWNNPLLMQIEQNGNGQGQAEWPSVHGDPAFNGAVNNGSVAISHQYNLDEFRQREAASTLDQITQTTAPDGVTYKPTPLPADVAFPLTDPFAASEYVDPAAEASGRTPMFGVPTGEEDENGKTAASSYCEDYPACGHTPQDPCNYSGPTADDMLKDPARYHVGCDHETGYCDYEDEDGKTASRRPLDKTAAPLGLLAGGIARGLAGGVARGLAGGVANGLIGGDEEGDDEDGYTASRRIAAPADDSCRSCDATGKTKDGKFSCGNCGGMGIVPPEVNNPRGFPEKKASRKTAARITWENMGGFDPADGEDKLLHRAETEDRDGNVAYGYIHQSAYDPSVIYTTMENDNTTDHHDHESVAAAKAHINEHLRGYLPGRQHEYGYTASRKTADMYGNSDMPHAVPQPNVANTPATTPQPQQGGSYSAGFAAGMADATVGDAPTYSDNSSGLEFSRGYVEGYRKGFDVVKSRVQKDQPYSAGGDNGQALLSGTAGRKKGPAADLPTDVSKLNLDRPKRPMMDFRQEDPHVEDWIGHSPQPNAVPANNENLKRQLENRTSSLFTPEEAFEIADFRKAYKFASKWDSSKPLVRIGSAEFEAGLYAGISDNPSAQDAWIAKHRKQASKFPEFDERIALHKDFSVKMLDSTNAMVKSAYLVQAATSTDLDTMAPGTYPSASGATPINGPGRPGPLAGGDDPAAPGGPAPYNGAEPFGQSVVPGGVATSTPATNQISEARKLANFRNTVQNGLSSLAGYPQNRDRVMDLWQKEHDNDDGLDDYDPSYNPNQPDTVQEWRGEK